MSEEEKKLKAKEQSESLADSKKIDLYINNEKDEEQGISIMNVFSRLRQRFHIYGFVMLIGLLAGLLVPSIMYVTKDRTDQAVAIVGLDYAGAEEGLDPKGNELDITYIKSSYVVQTALNNVVLPTKVSASQVQSNLKITGILTEETRQQMDIINKLEEVKNNEYGKLITSFSLKYRAQYIISLKSVFKDSNNNKTTLSSTDTSRLLNAITDAYNDYFVEAYQEKKLPSNYLEAINETKLDYLDILDQISSSYDYLDGYCQEKNGYLPNFRASNGKSFADLSSMIDTIKDNEIDDYYSYIYLNHVSKDKDVQLTNYKIEKREAEYQLDEVNTNIANLQTSIANYKPDKVKVNNTDGSGTIEVDVYPEAYYQLILDLKSLNETKSSLQKRISILSDRIAMLEGPDATDEQKAKAAEYVAKALTNARNTYDLVKDVSSELFASNSYRSRYMHTVSTYTSETLSSNLKTFALGAGVGLGLGLVIWVADAFILEFRDVKRRNEQLEKEAR